MNNVKRRTVILLLPVLVILACGMVLCAAGTLGSGGILGSAGSFGRIRTAGIAEAAEAGQWVKFPFKTDAPRTAEYLYVAGGYHSIDNGCPAWGTADTADIRAIGDTMGELVVSYSDGTEDRIPLVFGYTMWFRNNWADTTLPFKGDGADPELQAALQAALSLYGAYEGNETCFFRLKLRDKPVSSIKLSDASDKNGTPVFHGAFFADSGAGTLRGGGYTVNAGDPFFDTHTVDSADPYPEAVRETVTAIERALVTTASDWAAAPAYVFPEGYSLSRTVFSGTADANIATGVVAENLLNLLGRVSDDGFIHTSYENAPSWRYDGFGAWRANANSYYDSFYSRDGGRAILSLSAYGAFAEAERGVGFGNRWMMYFPENGVTFNGKAVPGHYTVVVNKPMLYPDTLVPEANWPTAYTKARFGDDYKNLGNQETDGHGLMMLSNYTVWRNSGGSADWVVRNWNYINEGAAWILWCFENPEISLAKNGLLYAESEAGMMKYTLYCNVPCCLGMFCYAEMAEAAGKTAEAASWKACAETLKAAIVKKLSGSKGWISSYFGFYHDPVLTLLSDVYGYDVNDMDPEWVANSQKAFDAEIGAVAKHGYFGPTGIGYDHSMITQNALLLDRMAEATQLVVNLSRLSYAPGLPEPYIVPECIAVDAEAGVIRRQGDLGNLVQQCEALKCYAIVAGISPVQGGTLKLMPRLPEGWELDIVGRSLSGAPGTVDLLVSYPKDGVQTAQFTLNGASGVNTVEFRFGPLPSGTQVAAVQVDGVNTPCRLEVSGDSIWVRVSTAATADEHKLALIYGESAEALPAWPDEWKTHITDAPAQPVVPTPSGKPGLIVAAVCAGAVAVAAVTVAVVAVVRRRKRNAAAAQE